MAPSVHPALRRDSEVRSATTAGRRRSRDYPLVVQPLERREVLSNQSALVMPPPTAAIPPANVAGGFAPMFDGTNTAGWFISYPDGRAVVKNGQVLLMGAKKFFLVSRQSYSNFILTADVLIPVQGNSGLEFRSKTRLDFVSGYKAAVNTSNLNWDGGLWSQSRGWLAHPSRPAPVVPGQWNHYEVEAIGDHIVILVNNTVTVNVYNNLFTDGHIALQDHGTEGGVYRFKNVQIENLGG